MEKRDERENACAIPFVLFLHPPFPPFIYINRLISCSTEMFSASALKLRTTR
jgi:hypothetical protein